MPGAGAHRPCTCSSSKSDLRRIAERSRHVTSPYHPEERASSSPWRVLHIPSSNPRRGRRLVRLFPSNGHERHSADACGLPSPTRYRQNASPSRAERRAGAAVCARHALEIVGDTDRIRITGFVRTIAVRMTAAAPKFPIGPERADRLPAYRLQTGAIAKVAGQLPGRAVVVTRRASASLGTGRAVTGGWWRAVAAAIQRTVAAIVQHPAALSGIVVTGLLRTATTRDA